jgi:hypothetical protein
MVKSGAAFWGPATGAAFGTAGRPGGTDPVDVPGRPAAGTAAATSKHTNKEAARTMDFLPALMRLRETERHPRRYEILSKGSNDLTGEHRRERARGMEVGKKGGRRNEPRRGRPIPIGQG